jgi:prepilin-type N-terminal cleavage/methylation domain-containing protein
MGPRRDADCGFTLVELMIVIVLVGLFLPAMFSAMQTSLTEANQVQVGHQQISLAEATMEKITADCRARGLGFTYIDPASYPAATEIPGFTRSVEVRDMRIEGRPAKSVTVTVMRSGSSDVSLTMSFVENW